jgi:primosomal protein N' (replication factor Y)
MKFPILLPNIFNYPFTYESDIKLKIGDFVEVPFGKAKIIGVVWDNFENDINKSFRIKKIIRKLQIPNLKKKTIDFLNRFST